MDYRLQHHRAKLVRKYRTNKNLWPDGIDRAGNRWYGDGSQWPDDLVDLWATEKWLDDRLRGVVPVTLVTHVTGDVTPVVTQVTLEERKRLQAKERMRLYRARKMKDAAGGGDAGG